MEDLKINEIDVTETPMQRRLKNLKPFDSKRARMLKKGKKEKPSEKKKMAARINGQVCKVCKNCTFLCYDKNSRMLDDTNCRCNKPQHRLKAMSLALNEDELLKKLEYIVAGMESNHFVKDEAIAKVIIDVKKAFYPSIHKIEHSGDLDIKFESYMKLLEDIGCTTPKVEAKDEKTVKDDSRTRGQQNKTV